MTCSFLCPLSSLLFILLKYVINGTSSAKMKWEYKGQTFINNAASLRRISNEARSTTKQLTHKTKKTIKFAKYGNESIKYIGTSTEEKAMRILVANPAAFPSYIRSITVLFRAFLHKWRKKALRHFILLRYESDDNYENRSIFFLICQAYLIWNFNVRMHYAIHKLFTVSGIGIFKSNFLRYASLHLIFKTYLSKWRHAYIAN